MLFADIDLLDENLDFRSHCWVGVRDGRVAYVGDAAPAGEEAARYGEVYDGRGKLLCPAFYNAHAHAPMTLLRGYAENLPLQAWLNDMVFPFEAKITPEDCYWGTLLSCAEMARYGCVSFSDMYYHMEEGARAALDAGIKMNLSDSLLAFNGEGLDDLPVKGNLDRLIRDVQGAGDGRIVVDCNIHAEYTSNPRAVADLAAYAKEHGLRLQVHVSETRLEHEECKQRHGLTPAAYMEAHGIFDSPTTAAHCVWLEDKDFDILKKHNVSVACCPASNLKLASGYANIPKMLEKGINIALGTDGAASNNNLNILQDIYLFGVVYKGFYHDSTLLTPAQVLHTATRAGALSQGRTDCGKLAVGYKADLCVIDTDTPQFTPMTDAACNVVYAAQGADVRLTMVDGEVLYRDGEFKTIDIEKVKAETQKRTDAILHRL